MFRVFGAAVLAMAVLAAPAEAQKVRAGDAALIPKAEAALARIGSMIADFTFRMPGRVNTGRLFVDRIGRQLRMEFDPPLGHLLVASGARVDFVGGDGTQINAATQSTPLALVFGPDARLSGDVEVLEIATKGKSASFVVGQKSQPDDGKVILHFQQTDPVWTLTGWSYIDADGRFTKTSLSNQQLGVELNPALFERPPPR